MTTAQGSLSPSTAGYHVSTMRTMKRSSATEKSGRRTAASEAAVEGSRSARVETT